MLADNGSSWFISGAPDARWNNDDLHALTSIDGSEFRGRGRVAADGGSEFRPGDADLGIGQREPAERQRYGERQRQFSATVSGNSNQSVTWDVNGHVGGNSTVGFIDSISGLYTAPSAVPSPASVTVHATSQAKLAAVGSASVTISSARLRRRQSPLRFLRPAPRFVSANSSIYGNVKTLRHDRELEGERHRGRQQHGGQDQLQRIVYRSQFVPSPAQVTISAASTADPAVSASASITIDRIPARSDDAGFRRQRHTQLLCSRRQALPYALRHWDALTAAKLLRTPLRIAGHENLDRSHVRFLKT